MPLPASVPTGTVSGTWYTPSGNLAVGKIIFLLTHEIEIPDDPDGVVIPVRHEVVVSAGQLNATLPAGFYNTLVRLSELYYEPKVVEIVAGQNLNLPDAIGVVPPEELVTPVRSVNGNFPDASGNITVVGGGGVTSVNTQTGAVVLDAGDLSVDSAAWKALVGPNIQATLDRADAIALNSMSTGVRAGGVFTVDGGLGVGSTVSITAVSGQILNNTNAASPVFTALQAGPWTAQAPAYTISYWYLDSTGALQQTDVEPTRSQMRTRLYLYRTALIGGVVVAVTPISVMVQQSADNIRDLALAIGPMKMSGLSLAASGSNLTFQCSSGEIYTYGIVSVTDPTDPSTEALPLFDTGASSTFRYTTNTTEDTTTRTAIIPGSYQVGGVVQPIPGPPTTVGVHWVFVFPSAPNYRVAYGTTVYTDFTAARAALGTINPFDAAPAVYKKNAFLVGAILATKNASNLTIASQAQFITTNAFGALGGGLGVAGGGYLTESMILAKGDLIAGDAVGSTDIRSVGTNGQVLTADSGQATGLSWTTPPKAVKAFATTGKLTTTFGPGDTSGAWTVAPSAWRVTVPASVGDVLCLDPSILAQVGADAEMDVCSLNGSTPIRYYSSGTSTQGANGHGGLYMGIQYNRRVNPIRWVVDASDIIAGNVTLSYMFRSGAGITWGSGAYPNEITLINEGSP